jgi:transcriptional regulator with GAF, ATPase, and Fis domain
MTWFMTIGKPTASVRAIGAALSRHGLVKGTLKGASEPGLILLAGSSLELHEVLREASSVGARVLVAFVGDHVACDPWSLLDDGAEDVVRIGRGHGLEEAIARVDRWAQVDALVESDEVRRVVRGEARTWRAALREVVEIARFTSSSILITGETGTGKEVMARLVHKLDPRHDIGDLVLVDCTTVVPSLSGSEFFGHEKGAFTGALTARAGAFERADGGTLFLDEVGELPATLQAELLRVIQEGLYKPVGGNDWRTTSFRLVAATNRDLWAAQMDGRFRSDLYFRLAGARVQLPPLRTRIDDAIPLFTHFVAQSRRDRDEPPLDPAVADFLRARDYPGNVRDLQQLAIRVATRHVGNGPITPGDIPPEERPGGGSSPHARPAEEENAVPATATGKLNVMEHLESAVRMALVNGLGLKELKAAVPELATRIALAEAGGPSAAARLLGVSRRAVDYRRANGVKPSP